MLTWTFPEPYMEMVISVIKSANTMVIPLHWCKVIHVNMYKPNKYSPINIETTYSKAYRKYS